MIRFQTLMVPLCCIACALNAVAQTPASRPSAASASPSRVVKVYNIKYASSEDVAKLLSEIFEDDFKFIPQGGSVIASGPADQFGPIEEILTRADNPQSTQGSDIRIFNLLSAKAASVCEVITNLRYPEVKCEADERTNSVVMSGRQSQIDFAEKLIQQLDKTQSAATGQRKVGIIKLANAKADRSLSATIEMLLRGRGEFSLDAENNQVIVQADEAAIDAVRDVLQSLDVPTGKAAVTAGGPKPIRVRLVWLITGTELPEAAPPPPDLAEVIAELEKIGVKDLRLAAQTIVATSMGNEPQMQLPGRPGAPRPSYDFTVNASPMLENLCELVVQGRFLETASESPRLQLDLNATEQPRVAPAPGQPAPPQARQLCTLSTVVSVPLGHSVVLGVTPMGGRTSVFVLQLSSK